MSTAQRGCPISYRRTVIRLAASLFTIACPLSAAAGDAPAGRSAPGTETGAPLPPTFGAGCAGPIDDLLAGSAVDVGRRGFDLRTLGGGFALEAFDVRAEGDCDGQGGAVDPVLVVGTRWRHGAGGERLYVGQRAAEDPVANLLEHGLATFWWQGYAFEVALESRFFGPPPPGGAGAAAGSRAAGRSAAPAAACVAAPAGASLDRRFTPAVRSAVAAATAEDALLGQAIAALAPGLDPACFHRRVDGGWSDLAALDLGDPRPALPAGHVEAYLAFTFLEHPAPSCDGPEPAGGEGVSFSAAFTDPAGSWVSVWAVSRADGGSGNWGYIDDHGAFWSDDRYQYAISVVHADGSGDVELVRALAVALDPGFDPACLVQWRTLTPQEAVALGFRLAQPPAGYTETWSELTAQSAAPECEAPPPATYSLSWSFSDGGDLIIEAAAWRVEGGPPGGGAVPPNRAVGASGASGDPEGTAALSWTDAGGTSYWVSGYSLSGGEPPALELLEAVARSMDPTYGG